MTTIKLLNCSIAKLLNRKKQYNNIIIQPALPAGRQFNNLTISKGFTLIELLIVISIIGILVASATASWQNAQIKGRDGKRKADAKAVQQGLELYLQKNGQYPSAASGQIQCDILGDTHVVAWGGEFACTPSGLSKIIYMQQLPKDSAYQDTAGYFYAAGASFSYILSAKLENANDPDLTGLPCTPQTGRNWCVKNP